MARSSYLKLIIIVAIAVVVFAAAATHISWDPCQKGFASLCVVISQADAISK